MKTVLVVTKPFADYKRGDRIEDAAVVATLLASHVVSKFVVTKVTDDNRFAATTH